MMADRRAHHFYTYFDINYLPRALVLYRSLAEHVDGDFTLSALCLDDTSHAAVSQLRLPGFDALRLTDLEAHDPQLAATKPTRSSVEYYFTLTASLGLYVLSRAPDVRLLSYLDADLRFYASPDLVLRHMGSGSVGIIPHGHPPERSDLLQFGIYNVGMVAFRNDDAGRAALERWRAQCIEWCYDRVEGGRYADQRYLDDWPSQLERVSVIDVPGIGLGPWNASRYDIDVAGGEPTVNGHPLVFYHFEGFCSVRPRLYYDGLKSYLPMQRAARAWLYRGYVRDVVQAGRDVGTTGPSAASARQWARFDRRDVLELARRRSLLYDLGGRVFG